MRILRTLARRTSCHPNAQTNNETRAACRKVRTQQSPYFDDDDRRYGQSIRNYEEDNSGAQIFPSAAAYSMASKPTRPEKIFISKMHNQVCNLGNHPEI
jgi:hypothetical protein